MPQAKIGARKELAPANPAQTILARIRRQWMLTTQPNTRQNCCWKGAEPNAKEGRAAQVRPARTQAGGVT